MPRPYRPPVEVICEGCKEPFKVKLHRIKSGQGRFCSRQCCNNHRRGERHPRWAGERRTNSHGYVLVADENGGRVLEHRKVMAEIVGRPLERTELVHHDDEHKDNNDPGNLLIVTPAGHRRIHNPKARHRLDRWARHDDVCRKCGRDDRPHQAKGLCMGCYRSPGRASTLPDCPSRVPPSHHSPLATPDLPEVPLVLRTPAHRMRYIKPC